jgi:nitrogen fixation protein NifU and related proteins
MTGLSELYQEVILDHNNSPRNFREMDSATQIAEGYNPLCGDRVVVYLQLDNDAIGDISFQGSGCAISKASASMMTVSLKGKTRTEAEDLFQRFHSMVTGAANRAIEPQALGKLAAFSGVYEFPARVKCANLAWHALHAALDGNRDTVSTEEGESDATLTADV